MNVSNVPAADRGKARRGVAAPCAIRRGAPGNERRRKDVFQIIRPEAVLVLEEFIGHVAQPGGQRAGHFGEVGPVVFAENGAHG